MKEQDVIDSILHFRERTYKEKLSNDFVEVCVGPLFTREEEFHVQTPRPFRMPDESEPARFVSC